MLHVLLLLMLLYPASILINLNDKLLEHAGIEGKAVLVGNFSAFAIWSESRYAKRESADQRNIFDAMRELGL